MCFYTILWICLCVSLSDISFISFSFLCIWLYRKQFFIFSTPPQPPLPPRDWKKKQFLFYFIFSKLNGVRSSTCWHKKAHGHLHNSTTTILLGTFSGSQPIPTPPCPLPPACLTSTYFSQALSRDPGLTTAKSLCFSYDIKHRTYYRPTAACGMTVFFLVFVSFLRLSICIIFSICICVFFLLSITLMQ